MNDIKNKKNHSSRSVNILTDSIFSMSLCEQVRRDTQGMSADKMAALREQLRQHTNIPVVRPKRPDRKGINSEVVIEKRLAQGKLLKQFLFFIYILKLQNSRNL